MDEVNYSKYMNLLIQKNYELDLQNIGKLLIHQNKDSNKFIEIITS